LELKIDFTDDIYHVDCAVHEYINKVDCRLIVHLKIELLIKKNSYILLIEYDDQIRGEKSKRTLV